MPTLSEAGGAAGERARILREYERRATAIPADFYSLDKPVNRFFHESRHRAAARLLEGAGLLPLSGRRVLEVGCGDGGWLPDFEAWGAAQSDLAGIDLDGSRADRAKVRLPRADIRPGDAAGLPWPAGHFDVVLASTVFSSILDRSMKASVAAHMQRVLRPGGVILWYDFFVDNPANPNVRGVRRNEIEALFPGCRVQLSRITLAPPIARRVVPLSWNLARALEAFKLLNTHYIGLMRNV